MSSQRKSIKYLGTTRIAKYKIRVSSPRITPNNSLSQPECNDILYIRKKLSSSSHKTKKIKYTIAALATGVTITVLVVIAVLIPSITQSSKTSAQTDGIISNSNISLNMTPNSMTSLFSSTLSSSVATTFTILQITTTTDTTTTTTATTTTTTDTTTTTTATTTTTTDTTSTTTATTTTTTDTTTTTTFTTTTTTDTTTTTTATTTTTTDTTTTTTATTTTATTTTTTFSPTCAFRWYSNATTVAGTPGYSTATSEYLGLVIGLFFDSPNTLYVSDGSNHRIQQFFLGNKNGTKVAGLANGASGGSSTGLAYPSDVALDSKGDLYIADSQNHRIQRWRVNATAGETIAGTGSSGSALNQLNLPRSIVIDRRTDEIYVSDGGNNRIMMFTLNSTMGTIVAGGNGEGTNDNQLFQPRGLYFENITNNLIIANYGAHNILRWKIGDLNWTLIAGELNRSVNVNQSRGNTPTRFNSPWEAILDPAGNLYVADRYNHRIQFFRPGQLNGTTIAGVTGTSGTAAHLLSQPLSVVLDDDLNLYVSDAGNNRIQKFTCY